MWEELKIYLSWQTKHFVTKRLYFPPWIISFFCIFPPGNFDNVDFFRSIEFSG